MKNILLIIGFVLFAEFGFTQNELQHVKTSLVQVHEGVEGSGISSTTMYTFVAVKKIQMTNVQMDGKKLELSKGDTIIYKIEGIDPLQVKTDISPPDTINPNEIFKATFSQGKYFVYLTREWNAEYSRQYFFKQDRFIAALQDVVIEKKVYYAP